MISQLKRYIPNPVKAEVKRQLAWATMIACRSVRARRADLRQGFRIITYHRVLRTPDRFAVGTPEPLFAAHMRYLARWGGAMALSEVVRRIAAGESIPARTVVVTFDDGYADTLEVALPILRRYGIPATAYLTAGCIEERRPIWPDIIKYLLSETPRQEVELTLNGHTERRAIPDTEARWQLAVRLLNMAILEGTAAPDDVIEQLQRQVGVAPAAVWRRSELMSWEAARAVADDADSLLEFGAHTMTHPMLSRLPLEAARAQVAESKALMERRLGRPVRHFASPFGLPELIQPELVDWLPAGGFDSHVLSGGHWNRPPYDPRRLMRTDVARAAVPALARTLAWEDGVS
jgi:peptidoglycan/xylan/chitin deacetylase (PgdA/CDA1 family)